MVSIADQVRSLPPNVQNVLFSATFPEHVKEFADEFAPEANQIFLKKEEVTVEAIKQLYLECDGEQQKFEALSALYDIMTIGQSIVFCKVSSLRLLSPAKLKLVAKDHCRRDRSATHGRRSLCRLSSRR
jgi:superfamily II DNA/RNA helicase